MLCSPWSAIRASEPLGKQADHRGENSNGSVPTVFSGNKCKGNGSNLWVRCWAGQEMLPNINQLLQECV
eukprot:11423893-Prorocentrum_lima.AAC.1